MEEAKKQNKKNSTQELSFSQPLLSLILSESTVTRHQVIHQTKTSKSRAEVCNRSYDVGLCFLSKRVFAKQMFRKNMLSKDRLSKDRQSTDRLSKDRQSTDRLSKDRQSTDKLSKDGLSTDRLSTDRLSTDRLSKVT